MYSDPHMVKNSNIYIAECMAMRNGQYDETAVNGHFGYMYIQHYWPQLLYWPNFSQLQHCPQLLAVLRI